jgi:hypothetical protein
MGFLKKAIGSVAGLLGAGTGGGRSVGVQHPKRRYQRKKRNKYIPGEKYRLSRSERLKKHYSSVQRQTARNKMYSAGISKKKTPAPKTKFAHKWNPETKRYEKP